MPERLYISFSRHRLLTLTVYPHPIFSPHFTPVTTLAYPKYPSSRWRKATRLAAQLDQPTTQPPQISSDFFVPVFRDNQVHLKTVPRPRKGPLRNDEQVTNIPETIVGLKLRNIVCTAVAESVATKDLVILALDFDGL